MDKDLINEITAGDINLSSFKIHTELNPNVWDGFRIKTKIRNKLLQIADDFIDGLNIPWVTIKDIILTGSLANYNWSKYSDFDLHIVIDFNEVNDNVELVRNFFDAERNLWNNNHDIEIYCFDVEVYVQDENEEHTSTGVFSLEENKWLVKPSFKKPKLDKLLIKEKGAFIINQIDDIIKLFNNGEYEKVIEYYEILNKKIRDMRRAGLDRGGEFSYENITFKVLRRTEYLDKLREIYDKSYDLVNSMGTQCNK